MDKEFQMTARSEEVKRTKQVVALVQISNTTTKLNRPWLI